MPSDRAGSFLIGLTIGGALGGALALILAPRPGEEFREQLRERGIDIKERASQMAEQVKELSRQAVEEQRARFQQAINEGKEAAAKTRADLLSRYERAKGQGHM